ncbi:hypothetical protein FRC16_007608 [Serendipita sp. 398]|nr:hypothetical protein FRC16_007608 [Serendipita sp. 398]
MDDGEYPQRIPSFQRSGNEVYNKRASSQSRGFQATCYHCGSPKHMKKDCPDLPPLQCYNCTLDIC